MLETRMPRSGFFLRPVVMADLDAIAQNIFADVEIAKTLIHDVSSPEKVRQCADHWCRAYAVDSVDDHRSEPGLGLWAICEPTPDGRPGALAGLRGLFRDPALPSNTVEGFAAIAKRFWRRGLSSESSKILLRYAFEDLGVDGVYTNIWPLLNPASEAVQRRVGYEYMGRTSVLESFGEDRILSVLGFELWRISNVTDETKEQAFTETGTKLGQLAAEDCLSLGRVQKRVRETLPDHMDREAVFASMELGHANPGWATYRLSRKTWMARQG